MKKSELERISKLEVNLELLKYLNKNKIDYYHFKFNSEFYNKLKELRNNYTKCFSCGDFYLGSKRYGFCSEERCQHARINHIEKWRDGVKRKYGVKNYSFTNEFKEKLRNSRIENYGSLNDYKKYISEKISNIRNSSTKKPKNKKHYKKYIWTPLKYKLKFPELEQIRINKQLSRLKRIVDYNTLYEYFINQNLNSLELSSKIGLSVKTTSKLLKIYRIKKPRELVRSKQILTNLQKYGTSHPNKNEDIKNKIKNTKLLRYGTQGFNNNQKSKITNLEKYGVVNVSQRHFKNIEKLNSEYVRDNFIKDGLFNFEEFKKFFNMKNHAAYNQKSQLGIIEPNITNNHFIQKELFRRIKTKNKLLDSRQIIKPLELDIFLPDYKLAVEYNGLMFHSFGLSDYSMLNNTEIDRNIHYKKLEMCEELGITLLDIFEGENTDNWLKNIHRFFNFEEYKIKIEEFNEIESIEFLREYSVDFKYTKGLKFLGFKLNNEIENLISFKNNFIYYIESKNNFNINFIEYINTNFKGFYFKDNLRNSLRRFFNFEFIKRYRPNCYLIEKSILIKLFRIPEVSEKRFTFDCGFDVLRLRF